MLRQEQPAAPRWKHAAAPLLLGLLAAGGASWGAFHYGGALFLLTPVCIGIGAAWIPARPTQAACIKAAMLTVLAIGCLSLAFAIEGLICLVMATPLILPLAGIGGVIGGLLRRAWERPGTTAMLVLLAAVPGILAWDRPQVDPAAPLAVTTSVVVHATPEQVWHQTVDFAPITAPPRGLLAWGIAYPTHAVLRETNGQRCRECHFTTGAFIEPITVWDPPQHLAFDVSAQPPAMRELSPWAIHPPHLDTLLRSRHGEFRITDLGDGTTRLTGTTWYTIEIVPLVYWRWWSDAIIHRIHARVLESIAAHAEADQSAAR